MDISKPSGTLALVVKQFWGIENLLPVGEVYTHRIVPNGLCELMFYLEDKPLAQNTQLQICENSIISGQLSKFYDMEIRGKLSLFSISLHPYAVNLLFNFPSSETFNKNVPLSYLTGERITGLEEKLYDAKSFHEKVGIASAYLLERLKKSDLNGYNKRLKHNISVINKAGGNVEIDFLASEACMGRKQYERKFIEHIGCSPKKFLQTVRFQQCLSLKSNYPEMRLTELAYASGYFDQSHMINDFKQFTGSTPKHFFSSCEPYSDYFA